MKTIDVDRKNRVKTIRTIIQALLVLVLVFAIARPFVFPLRYKAVRASSLQGSTAPGTEPAQASLPGFVAVSYLGVEGTDTRAKVVIPQAVLSKHLAALKASGFVTISQEDIIQYYKNGTPLPEKALFLMFEDGLKDTPTLTQGLLEHNNFRATIWGYAANLENPDRQYLSAQDFKALQANTFWELGTSGYRLSYINVFDRYGHYVGQLNNNEYSAALSYLDRRYNHYLMDFLRDKDEIPLENNVQMASRIARDYQMLQSNYQASLGQVPKAHSLMHANTGKFASHDLVSGENERWIKDLFQLNFNREGYAYNNASISPYDLSRMQPHASWSVNHLLSRLHLETGMDMAFITGDSAQAAKFDLLEGHVEFDGNRLYLTTAAASRGLLRFKQPVTGDLSISARLLGNAYGSQLFFLGSDETRDNAIGVGLEDNRLIIGRRENNQRIILFEYDLSQMNQVIYSIDEDRKQTQAGVLNAIIRFDQDARRIQEAQASLSQVQSQAVLSVAEGAPVYTPPIDQLQRGERRLQIQWIAGKMTVSVDGRLLVENLDVGAASGNHVLLESRPILPENNQRNIYDPVYDAVFENLVIQSINGTRQDVVFTNAPSAVQQALFEVRKVWEAVNLWFLKNM